MTVRRLSLHSLAVRLARHLDSPAKFLETLHRPQLRDILETLDENEAALFFILGPVQFFKTLVGQLYLLRCHLLRPCKIGWYAPTGDFAKDFADTKLNLLLDTFPEILARQYDTGLRGNYDKTKTTKLRRSYVGGASHLLLSANNENDRTGKTLEKVLCDEPHLYEPGWLDQIFKRTKDYETTAVKLLMSTGMTRGQDVKGGEAAQIWDQTDQRLWHCRCPNCKKFFEPRFVYFADEKIEDQTAASADQITYPSYLPAAAAPTDSKGRKIIGGLRYERRSLPNGLPDTSAIAATIRYQCPRCGFDRLPNTEATRRALSGTYAQPTGCYVSLNSRASPRHFGWTFSAIAGRDWAKIAENWELAMLARSRGDIEPQGKVTREDFGAIWNPLHELKEQRLRPTGPYKMADLRTWGKTEDRGQRAEDGQAA